MQLILYVRFKMLSPQAPIFTPHHGCVQTPGVLHTVATPPGSCLSLQPLSVVNLKILGDTLSLQEVLNFIKFRALGLIRHATPRP